MSPRPIKKHRRLAGRRTLAVKPPAESKAEINVTPLIDVVLVLLIIFMVMTPLVEKDLAVHLSTEKRTQKAAEVAPTQVLVAVDGSGALQINSEPVENSQYIDKLRQMLSGNASENNVVFVVASDDVTYPRLVEAIDSAKRAGASTVGLAIGTSQ
jgi:biopolymer transport protein ExbD/biopolymer transport protein TolR